MDTLAEEANMHRNPFLTQTTRIGIAADIPRSYPARQRTLAERDAARNRKGMGEIMREGRLARQRREQQEAARQAAQRVIVSSQTVDLREVVVEPSLSIRNPRTAVMPTCRTLRVHEIAGRIERTPADTLMLLRQHGEYVRTVQSTVVWPAARDFILTQIGN